jgi:DNA replication protein DnaC
MEIAPDLVRRLKRLRLGGLLPTLPDRATHARQAKLSPVEFLELLLQDEIDRRDSQGLTLRVQAAGFDEVVTADALVWDTPVHYDRTRVRELFRLDWLAAQENVIFCGPVGVGKSWFAEALGYSACRAGHRVRFIKVAKLLLALRQARADHSFERELRTWLAPDLLILDDFGLRKLTAQESSDFYDVLVERDRRAATVITSNRPVDEWVALFDDPILANSALDRFAHRAHQIVMEGPSLRAARAPSPARGPRRPPKDAAQGGIARYGLARDRRSTSLYGPRRPPRPRPIRPSHQKGLAHADVPVVRRRDETAGGGGMFLNSPGGMILKNDTTRRGTTRRDASSNHHHGDHCSHHASLHRRLLSRRCGLWR